MKCSIFLLFLLSSILGYAQISKEGVFNPAQELTFLGVDYSKAQFVGPVTGWGEETTKSPAEIRDTYFLNWNNQIEKEPNNFKFAEATNRKSVNIRCRTVAKSNESAGTKHLFVDKESDVHELDAKDISSIVKSYTCSDKGIGMVFICEQMNKNLDQAIYWVTFIDMSSNKVLFTKKVFGKAGGFGFRNYWLGSIKSVLKQMKKEFSHWG